ncbi:MAG: type 4a pilus biogenesis protein PilO [Nitrospirae bacterium YQR-1]
MEKIDLDKLPQWQRILFIVLPLILVAVPFYLVIYSPKTAEIKKLKTAIKSLDDEITKAQKKVANLARLKEELAQAEVDYAEIKRQLPVEGEISSLLKQLSDDCKRSGLVIALWEPLPRAEHASGILYETRVRLDIRGSYHQLGDFLSRITSLNRIVNVSQMTLSKADKAGKDDVMLSINLNTSTFTSKPEPEGN